MHVIRSLLLGLILTQPFTLSAHARALTVDEKLSDLNQLVSMMKAGYGPLAYKADSQRIDMDALREAYAERIRATRSNSEFYYLLSRFVPEFHDSHFGASIPTTQKAAVPFTVDLVDGKVLIDTIDRKELAETAFPFARGDEVLEVGGVPVQTLLDELQKTVNAGYELTARRKAAMRITVRSGQFVPVPKGDIRFRIRHGVSAFSDEVALKWKVTGLPADEGMKLAARGEPRNQNFDQLSTAEMWAEFATPGLEDSYRCSGKTRITVPADATVIMTEPFVAYYHPTARGNLGYLRIPHYSPKNELTGKAEYEERFRQYEYAVSVLEKNTIGLVIDQDHNCGGSVDYLHRIASLFLGEPFKPLQFQLLATKEQYLEFQKWLKSADEHTLAYQALLKVLKLVQTSWEAGLPMTPRTSIDGIELVQPNPIRYTRPIVMTIDEMSGSGGDAFPALLQGNGRVKLVGTRTMGAGGHVIETAPLYYSQIGLRMTKSLFYRPDGVAVENNGAVPDFPYAITRDDFIYGYRGYQAFSEARLLELIR